MYIKRTLEKKILEINEDYSCLLLIGPRQVGKTTMLEHLMEGTNRQKVSLDDTENRKLAKTDPGLFLIDDGIIGSELFGNCSIDADESGYSYGYRSVPCYCQYNDHLFSLQEIGYCTDKIGKSYELFVVLVLDISDIPDEELTWFIEDTYDCLGTGVYLTNDDNDYDFASLLPLGKLHYSGSKHLCYLYMTSLREESRYPFDNCKVAIFIKAKQKDKYEYKSPTDGTVSKLHKTNEISFSDNITKEDMIPLDDADKSLRDYIVKRVNSYGDYYAGLANNN